MLNISILFAFLAMFCWGIGDFLIQRTTRKIGDVEALAAIGIIGSVALFPFIIKNISIIFTVPNLLLLLVLGIITFIAAIFNFEALKKGKLSVIDIILEIELPITIILGYIFFKERLTLIQFSIISLIFVSIIMMASKSLNSLKLKLEKGVFLAFLGAIGMGIINFLTAASSKQISPLMAIWVPWTIVSIMCLVYIYQREGFPKFIKNSIKFKYLILFMGIFDTLAWIFYAFAVLKQEISIITAITEAYPAIAIFLGVYINREKLKTNQYFGAALAIIACIILSFLV